MLIEPCQSAFIKLGHLIVSNEVANTEAGHPAWPPSKPWSTLA